MGYDAAGNLTNDGVHSYQYDAENNLFTIDAGATATYAYNGINQRQKAVQNGVTDRYGLDLAGRRSTTWLDGTTNLKLAQYYGDRGPLAFWSATDGRIRFEHQDTLGTERVRTNAGGAELVTSSLPFGELVANTGTDLVPSHFALLDQDLSADSGLSHATYREYSSTQGRWTSPDPYDGSYDASNPESLNRYSYVLNNPLVYIDPDGTTCVTDICVGVDSGPYSPVGIILNSFAPPISPVGNPSPGGGNFPGGLGYTGPGVVIPSNIFAKICGVLPSGSVSSISGNGNFVGTAGSLDVVTNFRTGETTGFFSPGYFAGAATAGGSVTTGYTFGNLGSGNSNFAGGFSAVSVGSGYLAGSIATSSGGPASPTSGINPTGAGHVTVVSAGVQTPGRAFSVNSTSSLPLGSVGKLLTAVANLANPLLAAANQACAAAGH